MNGFAVVCMKIVQDGAIPLKMKELSAVAIGVAVRCDPCIKLHVQKCVDVGARKEDILEATSAAVMMGGGPAWTRMPVVLETVE